MSAILFGVVRAVAGFCKSLNDAVTQGYLDRPPGSCGLKETAGRDDVPSSALTPRSIDALFAFDLKPERTKKAAILTAIKMTIIRIM